MLEVYTFFIVVEARTSAFAATINSVGPCDDLHYVHICITRIHWYVAGSVVTIKEKNVECNTWQFCLWGLAISGMRKGLHFTFVLHVAWQQKNWMPGGRGNFRDVHRRG